MSEVSVWVIYGTAEKEGRVGESVKVYAITENPRTIPDVQAAACDAGLTWTCIDYVEWLFAVDSLWFDSIVTAAYERGLKDGGALPSGPRVYSLAQLRKAWAAGFYSGKETI